MLQDHELPDLKKRFRTLIRDDLGLSKFREDAGDFGFRYEGMNLSMIFDEDDAAFVWLVMFGIHWVKADDEAAVAAVDQAVNQTNLKIKVVKLVRDQDPDKDGEYGVHVSVSFIAEDAGSQSELALERYLGQIKSGVKIFRELVGKAPVASVPIEEAGVVRH
jgi:hypothetical protein